ncbi:MAG TPA: WYL domain-containing protein, partial [Candidatus Synoicihabitans sp.]|nr:WYL domain-containing protein [Candidatus Synoicihabitans sp.]
GESRAGRRRVCPYHLANRENLWYLVALDQERGALRTFALPRIAGVEVTAVRFARPEDFSPERFFANALGVLGGSGDFLVRVRFTAEAAERIREREWHESQVIDDLPDGRIELQLRLGALAEVERWVLGWGSTAEVVEPGELRQRLAQVAAALRACYGEPAAW